MSGEEVTAKVVPIPGPLHKVEKELYEPNYLKNVTIREAPPSLEFYFDRPNQFTRINNLSQSSTVTQSISEIQRNPVPSDVRHWHVVDTADTTQIEQLPRSSDALGNSNNSIYVHCAPRPNSPTLDSTRRLVRRHRTQPTATESLPGYAHVSDRRAGSAAESVAPVLEIVRREYALSDGKRHYIYDVRKSALSSEISNGTPRSITLNFPILRRAAQRPAVVPWCVADELYTVPDNSRIEYLDEYYWVPKIVYDARLDGSWSAQKAHLFNQLPDGATLPDNVIPAFTNRTASQCRRTAG